MIRKTYNMKDTEIIFLEQIRQEQKLGSEIAALHFVLKEYQTLREEEILISKAIKKHEEENIGLHERLRWSTRTSEQNTITILDILNTILLKNNITECVPVDVIESPVIATSKKQMKEKLAYFKQQKDDRKNKNKD